MSDESKIEKRENHLFNKWGKRNALKWLEKWIRANVGDEIWCWYAKGKEIYIITAVEAYNFETSS